MTWAIHLLIQYSLIKKLQTKFHELNLQNSDTHSKPLGFLCRPPRIYSTIRLLDDSDAVAIGNMHPEY